MVYLNRGLRPTASRGDRRPNGEPTRLRDPVHWLKIEKIGVSEPVAYNKTDLVNLGELHKTCFSEYQGWTIHSG